MDSQPKVKALQNMINHLEQSHEKLKKGMMWFLLLNNLLWLLLYILK